MATKKKSVRLKHTKVTAIETKPPAAKMFVVFDKTTGTALSMPLPRIKDARDMKKRYKGSGIAVYGLLERQST